MTEREIVVSVFPRNGAWMIHFVGRLAEDLTPVEEVDCASSIRTAKRLAIAGAKGLGYLTPLRWLQDPHDWQHWELEAGYAPVSDGAEELY